MPFKSKKQRRLEKYFNGGSVYGNSHNRGGVPIEVEGGEFIIKKDSVNRSTLDILEYINRHGDLPISDARNRGKK